MATSKITLHYKEVEYGLSATKKHFDLVEASKQTNLLGDRLNIGITQSLDKTKPRYTVKELRFNKWSSTLIGFYKSHITKNHFVGDLENRSHLVICEFSKNLDTIRIIMYPDFYPYSKNLSRAIVGVRTTGEY